MLGNSSFSFSKPHSLAKCFNPSSSYHTKTVCIKKRLTEMEIGYCDIYISIGVWMLRFSLIAKLSFFGSHGYAVLGSVFHSLQLLVKLCT